ncbi:MAG: glycerate kinase [Opitutae bacterium]|nr:glycerate kinase [Opitutae bacterium]
MRVLVAFDKFKDALSAHEAGEAAAQALRDKHPDWELDVCALTDGGEGFCEVLCESAAGRIEPVEVDGPRLTPVIGEYGVVAARSLTPAVRQRLGTEAPIALVELASASGLDLVAAAARDPWLASTYGTGQLLRAAAQEEPALLLLGIGGSATNDLGLGALMALGFSFFDAHGNIIAVPTPSTWERIVRIERGAPPELPPLFIACDVDNPLLGPRGATATFGPQKGLSPDDAPRFEAQMARMATLLCETCGQSPALTATPGAGAAGGIAFGLMVACGAKLVPGFEFVSDWLDLPARIAAADLILTGEGRFDATSLAGKGPGALVREGRRLGKPVHVFAGSLEGPADATTHAITPAGMPLTEALPRTAQLLAATVARVW